MTDLWGRDAHALAEHVYLGNALDGGLQLGDAPAGVLGFVGERERAGPLAQQRVVDLDDAQLGHRLAGLLVGTLGTRRGGLIEASLQAVARVERQVLCRPHESGAGRQVSGGDW